MRSAESFSSVLDYENLDNPKIQKTPKDSLKQSRTNPHSADYILLLLVLLLVCYGLLLLYSTSAYNGRVKFHDSGYYFKKQAFANLLGLLGLYVTSRMDYHRFLSLAPWLYLLSLGLSLAVLFVGDAYNGSRRWLSLGPLSFQPS